jgi:hypothetical protein
VRGNNCPLDDPLSLTIIKAMKKKQSQPNKPMTIDDLALAIQGDFHELKKDIADIRGTMATKQDLKEIRAVMATKQDLADLREEMSTRFATRSELQSSVLSARDEIMEEIGKIKYAKEIDELRDRVQRVERELGIRHGHSAV